MTERIDALSLEVESMKKEIANLSNLVRDLIDRDSTVPPTKSPIDQVDVLYQDGKYDKAIVDYQEWVEYYESKNQVANAIRCLDKAASCCINLNRYGLAAEAYEKMCKTIIDKKDKLLVLQVSKYLKKAALCYLLTENDERYKKVLSHPYLREYDREQIERRTFYRNTDFDEQALVEKLIDVDHAQIF